MRINRVISELGAIFLILAPVSAWADQQSTPSSAQPPAEAVAVRQRPHPEYDARGLRLGTFNLNAGLDTGVAYTDNLFASPDATAVNDWVYSIAPNLHLKSDWTRHSLAIDATSLFTKHNDFTHEDSSDYALRGAGRLDVGSDTNLTAGAIFSHETTPRTDPDSPQVGKPVNFNRDGGNLGASHRFAHTRVSLGVSRQSVDYHGTQNFRDYTEDSATARVVQDITPTFGVLLEGDIDNRDYKRTPGLGSDAHTFLIGASLNGDLFRGELAVGQFSRDFKAASLKTVEGLAVEGNVQWFATELDTVTFNARRDSNDDVGAVSGLPYVTNEYGAQIDHELLRNVILSAGVDAGSREYDTIDRTDDFQRVHLQGDYVLNRRVSLNAAYDYSKVDSSGAQAYRDYNVNTFMVSLGLHL